MNVTHLNKSENGKEIDIEGISIVGNVPFFAECKAKDTSLNSTDIQKFGYKFIVKFNRNNDTRGFIFTLSDLNPKAQEVWESELKQDYGDKVECYFHDQIVDLLIEHYELVEPELIVNTAEEIYGRDCGDTQLLCIENSSQEVELYWAQLVMSTDSSEPNAVALYNSVGDILEQPRIIEHLLSFKPDLATKNIKCLNKTELAPIVDDISPTRRVVRVRMSSSWFDYRFPSAPEYFVGRNKQLSELSSFLEEVRNNTTTSRGILITGKSGIGKSSLAIKARDELHKQDTVFVPIDSRLCDDMSFIFDCVNELLYELRNIPELSEDLKKVYVKGLDSLDDTLNTINDILDKKKYLTVLFFDQFEKVFDYPEVTRAIRDLFFHINENRLSILFGFAWKSDLWSLAEGFPHYERDDIAQESRILTRITEFGPNETKLILEELENHWGSKLNNQIKRQITTFSRGLPWLLKKVCSHIIEQKEKGITEEELIETNLKLQNLFEADLDGLDEEEKSLLKAIAPLLPATLQKLSESFEITNIDQSLHRFINKRILVKITQDVGGSLANVKYDAYSDIFREFLITGIVPIQEAYYFFTYPKGALNFFEKVRNRGKLTIEEEVEETGKQKGSIYNLSRDLRSVGLISLQNGIFRIAEDVNDLDNKEILVFIQSQLKQNRLISTCLSENNQKGEIYLNDIAQILQELFPSVQEFKETTLEYYSKITAKWLHQARLAFYDSNEQKALKVVDDSIFESVIEGRGYLESGYNLPVCYRNAIIECLREISNLGGECNINALSDALGKSHQSVEKALSDNINLGFVKFVPDDFLYKPTDKGKLLINSSEEKRRNLFAKQCLNFSVFNEFISHVEEAGEKGINSRKVADKIVKEQKINLADSTIDKLSGILANWAEYAGIIYRRKRLCFMQEYGPEQKLLF